jgi:hypothetical protein
MHNFGKNDFLLRTEIDNQSSNFTGNTMRCVASFSYQKTCIFMSYGLVNAQISRKKATDWSGLKVGNISKKPGAHGINRKMKGTSRSMLNLKAGCRFHSGEK